MTEPEKSKEPQGTKGWSTGTKALVGIVVLILVLATLAVFTLTVAVMGSLTGSSLPYTTNYRVTLPDGEPVTIGNSRILVASYDNELFCDVDGTKEKLVVGQKRAIGPGHAKVTVMGLPVIETDFQITLTYLGSTGKNANFDMSVKTSTQVPEMVIRHIIPSSMHAQPV